MLDRKERFVSIFAISLICISILFLLAGCAPKKIDLTAKQVVVQLKDKGMPVGKTIDYTAENDPNELLGRPDQYTSKTRFEDTETTQNEYSDEPIGGSIEVFESNDLAKERKAYIDGFGTLSTEYSYVGANILLRIDKEVLPDKAEKYRAAFDEVTGVKSEDTVSGTKTQKENEETAAQLEAAMKQQQEIKEKQQETVEKLKESSESSVSSSDPIIGKWNMIHQGTGSEDMKSATLEVKEDGTIAMNITWNSGNTTDRSLTYTKSGDEYKAYADGQLYMKLNLKNDKLESFINDLSQESVESSVYEKK